ncbi:MAG: hypothetical protein U5K79_11950 [Cyclobacteriaceae bacterium]|nr:hypothetical protein [Cyclobacteriaceae bacterium]
MKNAATDNWHWHWNTGNGDIGNQGPHQFDIARWGLNKDEHPVRIQSSGGYYKYTDCSQETPRHNQLPYNMLMEKYCNFKLRGLAK